MRRTNARDIIMEISFVFLPMVRYLGKESSMDWSSNGAWSAGGVGKRRGNIYYIVDTKREEINKELEGYFRDSKKYFSIIIGNIY